MLDSDLIALLTTLKLAAITTVILMLVGTPMAWGLSRWQSKWKVLAEAVVALPLVLPPTVLGFYLLIAFAPDGSFGQLWQTLTGNQLAFSFSAIVIGSVFYSLPFVVQPLQKAFEQIDPHLINNAAMLGAGKLDRFFYLILPMSKASFITAATLGFAHTVGEFGVVLMIGGNIPDETRVLSIALFDHVESFNYQAAHQLALGLLIGSVIVLAAIYLLNFYQEDKHQKKRQLEKTGKS